MIVDVNVNVDVGDAAAKDLFTFTSTSTFTNAHTVPPDYGRESWIAWHHPKLIRYWSQNQFHWDNQLVGLTGEEVRCL